MLLPAEMLVLPIAEVLVFLLAEQRSRSRSFYFSAPAQSIFKTGSGSWLCPGSLKKGNISLITVTFFKYTNFKKHRRIQ